MPELDAAIFWLNRYRGLFVGTEYAATIEDGMNALLRFMSDSSITEDKTFTGRGDKLYAWIDEDQRWQILRTGNPLLATTHRRYRRQELLAAVEPAQEQADDCSKAGCAQNERPGHRDREPSNDD